MRSSSMVKQVDFGRVGWQLLEYLDQRLVEHLNERLVEHLDERLVEYPDKRLLQYLQDQQLDPAEYSNTDLPTVFSSVGA